MVLNGAEIKKAIEAGDVVITQYILTNESTDFSLSKPVPNVLKSDKIKDSHKIKLHVGYLLRTLSDKKWLDPKCLYNKRDGIVDLCKLERHQYKIMPGETVLIFTNEVIEFKENYFGLVLSKVSHEEKGLLVSSTYVDPNWKGVLQLVVTNRSETSQLLQEGCEIANLIVHKMSAPANATKENRNGHYGIAWDSVSVTPTVELWKDRSRTWILKVFHFVRTYYKVFITCVIMGLLAALYYIVNIIYSLYSMANM